MKSERENECTYAEKFQLNPISFDDIQIDGNACELSKRTSSRLLRYKILTAGDLLRAKESDLREISGFGQKCADEVSAFLQTLTEDRREIKTPQKKMPGKAAGFRCYRDDICNGDFSFAQELELTDDEKSCLYSMQEGHDLLEQELVAKAIYDPDSLLLIRKLLLDIDEKQKRRRELAKLVEQIPENRRGTSAIGYINIFSENESSRDILKSIYENDDAPLESILRKSYLSEEEMTLAVQFLKWCTFDIEDELRQLFDLTHTKENMRIVLRERSNNATLEAAGQILGVTRERVRQIEKKARQLFSGWYNRTQILSKIAAVRDGDYVLTPVELQEYFGQHTTEILYLLRTTDGLPYLYDSQAEAFIVEELDQSERVRNFVEELPDTFNRSKLDSIQKDAEEQGLSGELLMLSVNEAYTLSGTTYHRSRLSIQEVCRLILKKYYADGIHAYDEQQLSEFRKHVEDDFGDISLPKGNRALSADIMRVSILCGRGRYKLYEKEKISRGLLDSICRYIDESEKNVFMTNTLFSVFEDDLLAEGITNKYFLQGLMHAQLGDRYVFRRDYVSKDDFSTNMYMEIVSYIRQFDYPVSKKQVFDEYPGLTEIVFNFSVSDPKIINLRSEYIHADKMNFNKADIKYFRSVLEEILSKNNGSCNSKDVYEYIDADNPTSMRRLYIMYQYSLFSVFEYLFREEYQFSRPYIAYPNVEIAHASERMDELLRNADEITLAEINEYAREIHFGINSILNFADEHNDTHLLKNDKELISIETSGVDEACAGQIEKLILDEIEGTMLISELKTVYKFPGISVPWTEWLIYSVLKKWSKQLDVGAESAISARQFRHMHPIVAIKGRLSLTRGTL